MKFTSLFLFFGLIVLGSCLTKEEAEVMFKKVSSECQVKDGVGPEAEQKFINHEMFTTKKEKCYGACTMVTLGFVTADGKAVKETFMMGAEFMKSDNPDKMKIAEEIVDACMGVTDPDICEAAFKIGKCLHDTTQAKGLEISW